MWRIWIFYRETGPVSRSGMGYSCWSDPRFISEVYFGQQNPAAVDLAGPRARWTSRVEFTSMSKTYFDAGLAHRFRPSAMNGSLQRWARVN